MCDGMGGGPEPGFRPVWSHACTLDDLITPYTADAAAAGHLDTGPGWGRRWTARWKTAGADVICPVQDLAGVPAMASVPVRGFTWRARQRHRPGLQYLVTTGRMHGFESLAERRLLVAVDFAGDAGEVLSQPFTLRFTTMDGAEDHIPDFLVLLPGTAVLVDVRPAALIKKKDMACDEDRYRILSQSVRSSRSPVVGGRLVVRYRPSRLIVGWPGGVSRATSAGSSGYPPGGEMFKGGLGVDRLPEDDDVDHDAEAVELVFLPGLVVLAEPRRAPT
jgi:hypothetical protein